MANGIYLFEDCVPSGAIQIANIAPGDVVNRDWTFRVNGRTRFLQTPLNETGGTPDRFAAKHIVRGYDGFLYDASDPALAQIWLAQVTTWSATFNPTVTDYQAAGYQQTWGIPMSFTVELTFTETVFTDRLLKRLSDSIVYGNIEGNNTIPADASFTFRGVIKSRVAA
jgi:hypothetical protein